MAMDRKRNTARMRTVSLSAMPSVTDANDTQPRISNRAGTPNKRALLLRFWRTLLCLRGAVIEDSAVQAAVSEGRLPRWITDDKLRPTELATELAAGLAIDTNGGECACGPAPLSVTCGSKDGTSMRIRVLGGELEISNKEAGLVEGQVVTWDKVGVITSARRDSRDGTMETHRYWLLEPGGPERRVELGPFKVVGRFTERDTKTGKAASEAWHALERPGK